MAPHASTMASFDASSTSMSIVSPTAALVRNSVPSASIWAQPPVEVALLHLELGDAVAQQAADAVGALEHDDVVAGAGQLLGGGEAGRAGADHGDPLAGLHRRHLRA